MKRKRGSVMLFVIVMVSMMTVSILAGVQLATSAAQLQSKRELNAKARYAYEGAIQLGITDYKNGAFSLPNSTVYTVGDYTVKLTASDNSTSITRTVKMDGEVSIQGKKFVFTRTIGNRSTPNPFYYAVFCNQNFDPVKSVLLGSGGANGDFCVNGSIVARTNAFTINGDLEETGTTLPATASITGNILKSAPAVAFPAVNKASYQAASPVVWGAANITGLGFPVLEPYQLLYRTGGLEISGVYTGKGTIFVDGDVVIKGNVSYGAADSRLVVIVSGRVSLDPAVTSFVGCYWSPVEFKNTSTTSTLTLGAIAAEKISLSGPLNVVHDPAFWNDPQEAVKHRVPGFWP